jgi:hypothetical protein
VADSTTTITIEIKGNTSRWMIDDIVENLQKLSRQDGFALEVRDTTFFESVEPDLKGPHRSIHEIEKLSWFEKSQIQEEFRELAKNIAFVGQGDENDIYRYRWFRAGTIIISLSVAAASLGGQLHAQKIFERVAELAINNGCEASMTSNIIAPTGSPVTIRTSCRAGPWSNVESSPPAPTEKSAATPKPGAERTQKKSSAQIPRSRKTKLPCPPAKAAAKKRTRK